MIMSSNTEHTFASRPPDHPGTGPSTRAGRHRALHAGAEPLFRASQVPSSPLLGHVACSCVIGLCEVTRHLRLSLRSEAEGDSDAGMGMLAWGHTGTVTLLPGPPERPSHPWRLPPPSPPFSRFLPEVTLPLRNSPQGGLAASGRWAHLCPCSSHVVK